QGLVGLMPAHLGRDELAARIAAILEPVGEHQAERIVLRLRPDRFHKGSLLLHRTVSGAQPGEECEVLACDPRGFAEKTVLLGGVGFRSCRFALESTGSESDPTTPNPVFVTSGGPRLAPSLPVRPATRRRPQGRTLAGWRNLHLAGRGRRAAAGR